MNRGRIPMAERIYAVAAWLLLPAGMRSAYLLQMTAVFAEIHGEARRRRGALGGLAALVRELRGLVQVSWRERRGVSRVETPPSPATAGGGYRPVPRTEERNLVENLFKDVKYGLRMLVSYRGVTVAAVLSLALGIGANTAIYTTIQGIFFPPFPVEDPDALVSLFVEDPRNPGFLPLSYPNYEDLRDRNDVFAGLAAERFVPLSVHHRSADAEQAAAVMASSNYFEVIGARAAAGRLFGSAEAVQGDYPVVVLNHGFWQRRFGGDPAVIGDTVFVNRQPFTVIGVTEEAFDGTQVGFAPELYVPAEMFETVLTDTTWHTVRRALAYNAIGRLAEGISLEQAQQSIDALASELAAEFPTDNGGRGVTLMPTVEARVNPNVREVFVQSLGMMSVIVGLVLLIACANVANLLLSRAAGRRREVAVRLALGARRGRLVRQMLTESVLLAALGGLLGLVVAGWTTTLLVSSLPQTAFPLSFNVGLDADVLLFTVALALTTGIVFGLAPAMRATRPQVVPALKGEPPDKVSDRAFGLRNGLVVAQVAVSLMLLIAAGLFVRSMQHAQAIDPGFRVDNALVYGVDVGLEGYSPEQGRQFFRDVVERVAGLPGVESAAVANRLPLAFGGFQLTTFAEDQDRASEQDGRLVDVAITGMGVFDTLGQRIVAGRDFDDADRADGRRVVIVNEPMAEQFWPERSALGRRIYYINQEDRPLEVVGIVSYAKVGSLGEDPTPMVYMPIAQEYAAGVQLLVRTAVAPQAVAPQVREAILNLDSRLPLLNVVTLDDVLDLSLWPARTAATLLGAFGILGLALAAVGLSGVIAQAVARRTREIGVRVALGAEPAGVVRMVMAQGFGVIAVGTLIGFGLAAALSSLLASLLYGVGTTDLLAFGVGTGVLVVVAGVASYLPARRATRIDPVVALRAE